jgi:hypothetical protein
METNKREVVSRRDLLGVIGGAASAALTGCAPEAGQTASPEAIGSTTDKLVAGSTVDSLFGFALVQEIRFPISTAAIQASGTFIPAGGIVTSARLDIVTPYSAGAAVQVGQSATASQLMSASDSNPQVAGLYVVDQDTPWGPPAAVVVSVTGAPGEGAGFCIVSYIISGPQIQRDTGSPDAATLEAGASETPNAINKPYATWRGGINLPSGYGVTLMQGGTVELPSLEYPLTIQPRDPAKAPFQLRLASTQFNSTNDDVLYYGYNADAANPTEPVCRFGIEQDYEPSPGVHWLECYIETTQFGSNPGVPTYRPIGFVLDRLTGGLSMALQYTTFLNILGGPIGGPATQQIKIQDGMTTLVPSNYVLRALDGLSFENLAGDISIESPYGNLTLASGHDKVMSMIADAIEITTGGVAQAIFDTNVSAARFYPNIDDTGSVGISGQAWSTIFTHAINVSTPPSPTATSGANGAPPAQVAGYMAITVNGTEYMVPLYNP